MGNRLENGEQNLASCQAKKHFMPTKGTLQSSFFCSNFNDLAFFIPLNQHSSII